MHLKVKRPKMTYFPFHNWYTDSEFPWLDSGSGYGHLETHVVLLAPGLLVRVVAAEDEAVAGEGSLLGGGHDGVIHIRLTWVTHPQRSIEARSERLGQTKKSSHRFKLPVYQSFVWDLDKLFISELPVFTFCLLIQDTVTMPGMKIAISVILTPRQPMRRLHEALWPIRGALAWDGVFQPLDRIIPLILCAQDRLEWPSWNKTKLLTICDFYAGTKT